MSTDLNVLYDTVARLREDPRLKRASINPTTLRVDDDLLVFLGEFLKGKAGAATRWNGISSEDAKAQLAWLDGALHVYYMLCRVNDPDRYSIKRKESADVTQSDI